MKCTTSAGITSLIRTWTKFSNVIDYRQPDLSTNRPIDTSCLCKWAVRVMCACCCHAFRRFFYENVWPMSSLFLRFVILLITRDKQIGLLLRSCLILSFTCLITDRIGFHSELICNNYTGGTMWTQLLLKCQWWYINFFLLLGCDIYF